MSWLLAQASEAPAVVEASANVAEIVLFACFGLLAVGTAIAVVTMRNVVHGALMLVVNLLSIAGLYLALQAAFLSIVQVIVYAGAIVVLFLFVIMLLGVDRDDALVDPTRWHIVGAVASGLAVAALLVTGFVGTYTTAASRCGDQANFTTDDFLDGRVACLGLDRLDAPVAAQPNESATGLPALPAEESTSGAEFLGQRLFTRHTFAFEAAGLLLVVATIGALLLGKRHETPPDDDPAYELAIEPPTFDDDDEEDEDDEPPLDVGEALSPAAETPPGKEAA